MSPEHLQALEASSGKKDVVKAEWLAHVRACLLPTDECPSCKWWYVVFYPPDPLVYPNLSKEESLAMAINQAKMPSVPRRLCENCEFWKRLPGEEKPYWGVCRAKTVLAYYIRPVPETLETIAAFSCAAFGPTMEALKEAAKREKERLLCQSTVDDF